MPFCGVPERGDRLAIVSMADGRTVAGVTATHLAQLEAAAGRPVAWENLCLPPTPAVLSDVVFFDHFLPRDPSPKFDAVIPALRALRSASMIIVDDVAELLFGQFAYPVLSHRFERSEAADLLVWRWQRYTERHHELPIGVLNLWQTQHVRNQFIDRLGRYLGVPVFRIATLRSFEALTADGNSFRARMRTGRWNSRSTWMRSYRALPNSSRATASACRCGRRPTAKSRWRRICRTSVPCMRIAQRSRPYLLGTIAFA